jgi:TonB family protein
MPSTPPSGQGINAPVAVPSTLAHAQSCLSFYPAKSIRLDEAGDVELQFTIATDGALKNITVFKSSGHDLLDQAATECASHWIYKPAMQNGVPLEVTWRAFVRYRLDNGPPPAFLKLERDGYRCVASSMPDSDEMRKTTNGTGINITLQNGAITDVAVFRSSGDETLDALALQCFRSVKIDPDDAKGIASEPSYRFFFTWNPIIIKEQSNTALPDSH